MNNLLNTNYLKLFKDYCKKYSQYSYNSFQIQKYYETNNLNFFKVPKLGFFNNSAECFQYALDSFDYFNSLNIEVEIYGCILGESHDINHICLVVTNPENNEKYIMEIFYNFRYLIPLQNLQSVKRNDGTNYIVRTIDSNNFYFNKLNKNVFTKYTKISKNLAFQYHLSILNTKTKTLLFVSNPTLLNSFYFKLDCNNNIISSNLKIIDNKLLNEEFIVRFQLMLYGFTNLEFAFNTLPYFIL